MEKVEFVVSTYILILNISSFILMGYDKKKAIAGGWRIPEKRIFIIAFIGGAVGIYAGMKVFRHKTRQLTFKLGIPLLVVGNGIVFYQIMKI